MKLLGYLDDKGRALVRLKVRGGGEWHMITATMANGSMIPACLIALEIEWIEGTKIIDGIAFVDDCLGAFLPPDRRGRGANALLGRALLANSRLTIDDGRASVAVEPSESSPA